MKIFKFIEELEELIDDFRDDFKEENITKYDRNIDYEEHPKLYEVCPHCGCKNYTWIKEVLEDAILKVKCDRCENNFYTDFSK